MSAARAFGLLLGVVADNFRPSRGLLSNKAFLSRLSSFCKANQGARDSASSEMVHCGHGLPGGLATLLLVVAFLAERKVWKHPLLQASATAAATWAALGMSDLVEKGTALSRFLENEDFISVERLLSDWEITRVIPSGVEETKKTSPVPNDLEIDHRVKVVMLSQSSIEAIADRTMDAGVTPLLWGALMGLPGLLASSALGAHEKYAASRSGKSSASETARFLSARMTSLFTELMTPVIGGKAEDARQARKRDVIGHPAPNIAMVRATFAGALKVRVGGRTEYARVLRSVSGRELPVLGDGRNPDAGHVLRAVELSRLVGWLAVGSAVALALVSSGQWPRRK